MSVIEVDNLTKDYGYGRGVFNVSLKVEENMVFGFLGPNGAGKSTTIRHLLGFSKPDSGRTSILGYDSFTEYEKVMKYVGYIPGEIALPDGLNGHEFIKMIKDMKGDSPRLLEMLDLFKLSKEDLNVETKRMSLGIKRKLAIVVAFMTDPKVLILDEPTSGLDPVMQEVFVNLIKQEKKNGKTILLSSHIFSEIDSTCDKISIIKDGKIVSEFNAEELKHTKLKQYELTYRNKNDFAAGLSELKNIPYLRIVEDDSNNKKIRILCHDDNINDFISYLSNAKFEAFKNIKETLEEYFMKFYKEDKDFGDAL